MATLFYCLGSKSADAVLLFYYYLYIVVGQEGLYLLSPLGEAPAAGIEVLLVADVVGLINVFEAVEVEVVYRLAVSILVLIGKSLKILQRLQVERKTYIDSNVTLH